MVLTRRSRPVRIPERACLLLSANKVVAADPCHGRVNGRKGVNTVNTVNVSLYAKVRAKSSTTVVLCFCLMRSKCCRAAAT
jgi:hypothetical protein